MVLVKSVEIDIGVKGDVASKAKLDAISARAEQLKKTFPEFTAKIDTAAASEKLKVFRAQLTDAARDQTATIKVKVDDSALQKLQKSVAGGSGLGGAGGLAGGVAVAGLAGVAAGGLGILPAVAAASLGLASFGALAVPTLAKVSGALTQIKADTIAYDRATTTAAQNTALAHIRQDWANLTPGQTAAVKGIQSLESEFGKLATALAPLTLKVLNDGLKLANDLLPYLAPFARAAGAALDQLLTAAGKFTQSTGFKSFIATMTSLSGPAITTIGRSFGTLVIALGKFLVAVASPGGLAVFTGLVSGLSVAIGVLGSAFGWITKHVAASDLHDLGVAILGVYAAVKLWAAVQVILDAALSANPIGLVVIALAAVSVAFFEAWKHSETFRDGIKNLGVAFVGAGVIIVQAVKIILDSVLSMIGSVLHGLADAFGWIPGGVGSSLRAASKNFDTFKSGTDNTINGIISKMQGWQNELNANKNTSANATSSIGRDFTGVGVLANNASGKVNALNQSLTRLPRNVSTNVSVFASGGGGMTFTEKVAASISSGGFSLHGLAGGGMITQGTGPTADDVLIRASRGELVVPANLVQAGAVDHLRGRIPGFASGGIAGLIPWVSGAETSFAQSVQQNLLAAEFAHLKATVAAAAKAAAAAAAAQSSFGPFAQLPAASGSAAQAQAYARGLLGGYGWGADQWPPLLALWNQESGWNANAVNPSSGAYGIPQSLGHGHPYNLGDYVNQVIWGLNYIQGRYGSPGAAWAHEVANNWYDKGGYLPPGLSLAYNGTGVPEQVIPPGAGRGGNTYIVNVTMPFGSTRAEVEDGVARVLDQLHRQRRLP